MDKRAYFFIIDSMIALSVLAIGVVLLFSYHKFEPNTQQSYIISEEIINMLINNDIQNINNYYAGVNGILSRNGNITDPKKNLLEQVAEFYYRNQTDCNFCFQMIEGFIGNVTQNSIPSEANYKILMNNAVIFERSYKDISEAKFITPSRVIVHGIYNDSEMFGPDLVVVYSWR